MKKTLIIILSLLLVIVAVVGLYINNTRKLVKYAEKNNKEYENFYQQEILGTTLISIINKAINDNEKNGVPKEEGTIYYQDNNKNSVQITIKFLDSDRLIKMEEISQKQTESFVNVFATASFKCTQIEYHKNTKCIKSLYFEQIYK